MARPKKFGDVVSDVTKQLEHILVAAKIGRIDIFNNDYVDILVNKVEKLYKKKRLNLALFKLATSSPKVLIEGLILIGILMLNRDSFSFVSIDSAITILYAAQRVIPHIIRIRVSIDRIKFATKMAKQVETFENQFSFVRDISALGKTGFEQTDVRSMEFTYNNNHIVLLKGQVLIVKGLSGCGKSTLLKNLLFLEPSLDIKINSKPPIQALAGKWAAYIDQFPTVFEGVLNVPIANLNVESEGIASALGLSNEQITNPHENLSGGEKQRIGLLRALCSSKDVILIDEVTSAQDSQRLSSIVKLLDEVRSSKIIILISHDDAFDGFPGSVHLRL